MEIKQYKKMIRYFGVISLILFNLSLVFVGMGMGLYYGDLESIGLSIIIKWGILSSLLVIMVTYLQKEHTRLNYKKVI